MLLLGVELLVFSYHDRMKTLPCDGRERDFSAETFEDWFKQMYAHYTADHADLMAAMAGRPKSEGEQWVADAKTRFAAA